jgi:hypothetical protein
MPRGPRQQRITLLLLKEGVEEEEIWNRSRIEEQNDIEVGDLEMRLSHAGTLRNRPEGNGTRFGV